MPFIDSTGAPLDGVHLLYRPAAVRLFQVEQGFAWIDPRDGSRADIPAHDATRPPTDPHNSTDLASVPAFLWGLVASYGHQTLPAILHDALSDRADEAPPAQQFAVRRAADDAFRIALRESGVTALRSTTMWAVVAIKGWIRFRTPRGALMVAQVVIGALAVIAAVVLAVVGHPLLLLVALAPAVLAVLWGRTAPLVIAGSYLGALYSPLIAGAAIASAVEYLIALVGFLVGGRHGDARARADGARGLTVVAHSAGILLHRMAASGLKVWLGHMGGPFWARKQEHAWSIPKGEADPGESGLEVPAASSKRSSACPLPICPIWNSAPSGIRAAKPSRSSLPRRRLRARRDPQQRVRAGMAAAIGADAALPRARRGALGPRARGPVVAGGRAAAGGGRPAGAP